MRNMPDPDGQRCLRILHIEDCPADAALLRLQLAEALPDTPYTLEQVATLAEAETRSLVGEGFTIALLDLQLPDARGLEIVRRMRKALPDATLVVMSGSSDEALAMEALGEGAQEYLNKGEFQVRFLGRSLLRAEQREEHLRAARLEAKRMREQALHDPMTGLPNRMLLLDRLGMARSRAERTGGSFAVAWFDLDRFKRLNDEYGHDCGDHALTLVGDALKRCCRRGDTVARVGGDEFIALFDPIGNKIEAENLTRRMQAVTARLMLPSPCNVYLAASAGLACWPIDTLDTDELLRKADLDMLSRKKRARQREADAAETSGDFAIESAHIQTPGLQGAQSGYPAMEGSRWRSAS